MRMIDADQLAEWCHRWADGATADAVTPADVMRQYRIGWSAACGRLEALQARGDLERILGPTLAWRPAQKPQEPKDGHQLSLSEEEREALEGLLDAYLPTDRLYDAGGRDATLAALRAIRERLRGTP